MHGSPPYSRTFAFFTSFQGSSGKRRDASKGHVVFEERLLIDNRGNLIFFRALALYLCSAAKLLEIVNYGFSEKYLDDSCMPSSAPCLIMLQNTLVLFCV